MTFPVLYNEQYLYSFWNSLRSGNNPMILLAGDSTTRGDAIDNDHDLPQSILADALGHMGLRAKLTNAAISGASTLDWCSGHAVAHVNMRPTLYIPGYGLNDAGAPVSTFSSQFQQALSQFRGNYDGQVERCSIILRVPNTCRDDAHGRNEAWIEAIEPVIYQMADQYKCAVFNSYRAFQDARTFPDVLDGYGVHPKDTLNQIIWSGCARMIFPANLFNDLSATGFINVSGTDFRKPKSDPPSSYPLGISIYRTETDWELNGSVFSMKHADGVMNQFITGYYGSSTVVLTRTAILSSDSWQETIKLSGSPT